MYRMFITSIKLCFFFNDIQGSVGLIDMQMLIIINISFIFDMFLSFNTGFYQKGIIVTDRKLIALNYCKGALMTDLLAQIPLIVAYFIT